MCGITGYFATPTPANTNTVTAMADTIRHRGPDSSGAWCDAETQIALGHRRLAILDLSEAGHQPMISTNDRYVLTYNGEIYNHLALRNQLHLDGCRHSWDGHSDTETLLVALQNWGIVPTLQRLNGMFAFALWDRQDKVLTLARDPLGEKPLYYGTMGGGLLFGSEIRALAAHPDWIGAIDRDALALFLRYAYVPQPWSIFQGIHKLAPGHVVQFSAGQDFSDSAPKPFWDLAPLTQQPRRTGSDADLLEQLNTRLMASVEMRMSADVGLGAFLSGGIDSSTIVALMQAQSDAKINTFTIGFDVAGYNEAESAKDISQHLGTHHTELYLTDKDTLDTVPHLPDIWDEPFADSSQIPTYILSRLTREHVTVALSGDGGDEVFCGYNRYGAGYGLYQKLARFPMPIRGMISMILNRLPVHQIDRLIAQLPKRFQYPALGDRVHKLAAVLQTPDGPAFYRMLVSHFQAPQDYLNGGADPDTLINQPDQWPASASFRETMMYLDTKTYLPGDILAKVDRASMAVSLETRMPFLDPDLIKFAWTLPADMKIRGGQTKWALREILAQHVPRETFERPKMGFGIPIEHWLTGALQDWANALLDPVRLQQQGLFNVHAVTQMWQDHLAGKKRSHYQLWIILMFQAWHDAANTWALLPMKQTRSVSHHGY